MTSRDELGRVVRETWVEWARERHDPDPRHLVGWDDLPEPDREVDRRIGEAVGAVVERDLRPITHAGLVEVEVRRAVYRRVEGTTTAHSLRRRMRLPAVPRAGDELLTSPDADSAPVMRVVMEHGDPVPWVELHPVRLDGGEADAVAATLAMEHGWTWVGHPPVDTPQAQS